MSACALSRLGYTVLILSPRLAATASSALMRQVESHFLLIAEQFWESCQVIRETMSATCYVCKLPKRSSWPSSSDKDLRDKGRYPDSNQFLNKTAVSLSCHGGPGLGLTTFVSSYFTLPDRLGCRNPSSHHTEDISRMQRTALHTVH